MRRGRRLLLLVVAVSWFLVPSVALADAAIPTLIFAWPGMGIMLIPIIALEALVLHRMLEISARKSALVSTVANFVTTLLGIPIAYLIVFGGVVLTQSTPWASFLTSAVMLGHQTDVQALIGILILLGAFFLVSWGVEFLVAGLMLRDKPAGAVSRAVLVGNALSYLLLAVIVVALTFVGR